LEGSPVVFQRSFLRSLPVVSALCGLLLVLPGCPLSPDEENNPNDDVRLDDPTTPELALNRLSQVWERKLYREYELLLHDAFEFFPLDTDADDFPWLQGESWGRTQELVFAANMFDPDFSGEQPPVDSIDWNFQILSQRETTDATYGAVTEVTTTALITVLTGPDQGFSSDTKFIFLIIRGTYPDPEHADWYQILEQREVPRQS
jgi:hypothetical protein